MQSVSTERPDRPDHSDTPGGTPRPAVPGARAAGCPPRQSDLCATQQALLDVLEAHIPFGRWMLVRRSGCDWLLLRTRGHDEAIAPGARAPWEDTPCARMASGRAPCYAPDFRAEPAYRDTPVAATVPVGAYLGVPIGLPDGTLFGSLCAISPAPRMPRSLTPAQRQLLDAVAGAFATLMGLQLELDALERRRAHAIAEAQRDPLTGLANLRGWQAALAAEQRRIDTVGCDAALVVIDADGLKPVNDTLGHAAGDALLQRLARALRASARPIDTVARIGGDEFALLMPEFDRAALGPVLARLREALERAGLRASLGAATCSEAGSLAAAQPLADARMYMAKEARRAA